MPATTGPGRYQRAARLQQIGLIHSVTVVRHRGPERCRYPSRQPEPGAHCPRAGTPSRCRWCNRQRCRGRNLKTATYSSLAAWCNVRYLHARERSAGLSGMPCCHPEAAHLAGRVPDPPRWGHFDSLQTSDIIAGQQTESLPPGWAAVTEEPSPATVDQVDRRPHTGHQASRNPKLGFTLQFPFPASHAMRQLAAAQRPSKKALPRSPGKSFTCKQQVENRITRAPCASARSSASSLRPTGHTGSECSRHIGSGTEPAATLRGTDSAVP